MTASNTDNLIIESCRSGKLGEFSFLYDKYADKIYNFIFYKTFHKETAQDLVSVTFMKALEKLDQYDPKKGNFSSWLYRIARNNVIDHYRTKKINLNIDEFWSLSAKSDTEKEVSAKRELNEVREHLKKLSSEQKEIIVMRVWDELSYKEISQILGKSEAACKMMFSRAINSVRAELLPLLLIILTTNYLVL
jgi:RNA polymerase sigma-70 factor, ECF subfamily